MTTSASTKQVKSAIRTMDLFTKFAEEKRPLTLGELAGGMKAPKSSTYELIQTLVQLGFLLVLEGGKVYYPSRRLWEMSEQIAQFSPIKEKIDHLLRSLRDTTTETIVVARMQNRRVVYTTVFDGINPIRYTASSGDIRDAHANAFGKALLSLLDEQRLNIYLRESEFRSLTPHTITNQKLLKDDIREQARSGLFLSREEQELEVMEIAVPLTVQGHQLAIGIVGPEFRVQKNLTPYRNALLQVVKKISG